MLNDGNYKYVKVIGRRERRCERRDAQWRNKVVIRSRGRCAKDVVRANKVCFINSVSTGPKVASAQAMPDSWAAGDERKSSTAPRVVTRTLRKQTGQNAGGRRTKADETNEAKKKGADGQDQRQLEFEEQLESHQGADSKGAHRRRKLRRGEDAE